LIHCDFHTGNILFDKIDDNTIFISDMGLCGEVGNEDKTRVYGIMPYVAPEVLRGKSYTQAADIYSFGMIMYFVATGRQPFNDCEHDHLLALDICNGIRPKINELEAPKCYIDLMKMCWDSNPENRPNTTKLRDSFLSIITESSEIEEAENYRNSLKKDRQITTHPKAVYISQSLKTITEKLSNCSDCALDA
jgi:serine/threonine protein kinase